MVSTVGAEQMSKDEAIELLKNIAEDANLGEEVYNQHFIDGAKKPLAMITKEQMHHLSIQFLNNFEK